jgi:hypothetical protein
MLPYREKFLSAFGSALDEDPAGADFINVFFFFQRLKQMRRAKEHSKLLQFDIGRSIPDLVRDTRVYRLPTRLEFAPLISRYRLHVVILTSHERE